MAMASCFGAAELDKALRIQAFPAIQALAENEHLRRLWRFERDAPPPYVSSTPSPVDDPTLPALSLELPLPRESAALLDSPITDQNRRHILTLYFEDTLNPGRLYHRECRFEAKRLKSYESRNTVFWGDRGMKRFGLLVRRNVKRRWQKLGIWNPAWGIPGRSAEPMDDIETWNWWWRQPGPFSSTDSEQLADRALQLRRNLRRGESVPVVPRSRLQHDTTASEADSFLISRPWFLWTLERCEESERWERIPNIKLEQISDMTDKHVSAWWRDRGECRDGFLLGGTSLGWKWRHESPSPEPEPLAAFEATDKNPLETLELTPSETDALEDIELPRSEWPAKFWVGPSYVGGPFPGQRTDDTPPEPFQMPVFHSHCTFKGPLFSSLPKMPLPREHAEVPPLEPQEAPSEPHQVTCSPPPQRPQRPKAGEPTPSSSTHRSTPVTAMKRSAEPLPSQAAPNKKPKTRATAKAEAPDKKSKPPATAEAAASDKKPNTRATAKAAAPDKKPKPPATAKAAAPDKKPNTRATAKAAAPDKKPNTRAAARAAAPVAPRVTARESRSARSRPDLAPPRSVTKTEARPQ